MKPVKNILFALLVIPFFFACKKDRFTNDAASLLKTTADTVHFDTMFTTTGSVSQIFKIVNNNNKGIQVNSIRLAGGTASPFRINVDGTPGPVILNTPVAANDSVYVFVTVTIDPGATDLPFIVRDSIEINYNGNRQIVQLDAFGQNAHFFRNRIITAAEIWNNDLPYVILGGLTVDTTAELLINKGTRIYMHADAPFIVHGRLLVNGEKEDSNRVVFAGDRLDDPYIDYPASYPGIYFTEVSHDNVINYAIIKNAYQAIVVTDPSPGTKLTLNETIIDNAYDAGLTAINTSIKAKNLLISNCGRNMLLVKGGNYEFTHLTSVSFSNNFIQHKQPVLVLTDFVNINGTAVSSPLKADFINCIFWGEDNGLVEDEVIVLRQGTATPQVHFNQVLWRVTNNPLHSIITGAINNQPPLFDDDDGNGHYDYPVKTGSPALDRGIPTPISTDLRGNPRPVGLPDLGAIERQ